MRRPVTGGGLIARLRDRLAAYDCGHRCCDQRTNPKHRHLVTAEGCDNCRMFRP